MTALADVGLYPELQQYGATDMSACFSCGTCTAICPLSENDATFPRRMIRYAQVGMKDALLSSKELWSCYHCGECSDSCPTEADPGEFMAAARRYAIASYDATGLARLMYVWPALGTAFALALAVFFALFMYTAHGPQSTETLAIFEFIPAEVIHNLGIVVMIVVLLAGFAGVARMTRRIGRREGVGWQSTLGSRAALARSGRALWSSLGRESLGQARFRVECES
jgi:ferredoxin